MSFSGSKGYSNKPLSGATANLLHPINRDLIGWWPHNEGVGTTIQDVSGHQLHATLNNMDPKTDWVGSPKGGALAFDGSDDFTVTGQSQLLTPAKITVSAVYKTNATPGNWAAVVSYAYDSGSIESGYVIWYSSGGVRFSAVLSGGVYTHTALYSTVVGDWHHVVGVIDETNIMLYVNGSLFSSVSFVGAIDYNPTPLVGLHVGKFHDDNEDIEAPITVDDIRLWGRALTPNEIRGLYADTYIGMQSPLYRRWPSIAAALTGAPMPAYTPVLQFALRTKNAIIN